jgi:hypothetical protein
MIVRYLFRGHRRMTRYGSAPSQTTGRRRPGESAGHDAVAAGPRIQLDAASRARRSLRRTHTADRESAHDQAEQQQDGRHAG